MCFSRRIGQRSDTIAAFATHATRSLSPSTCTSSATRPRGSGPIYAAVTCRGSYLSMFDTQYISKWRQLKTFLAQIGSALPLITDPPVRLYDDQKGRTTIEIAIWGAFLSKS
jgi:hypothetical protein